MKEDAIVLTPLEFAGDIHVMVNLLSDVGFKRNWIKSVVGPNDLEKVIFDLIIHYHGTKGERLKIFHLIQIWGGYSGRNIYLDRPDGFDWDCSLP